MAELELHVCAEVQYKTSEGSWCHSDLCMHRSGNDFSLNVDQVSGGMTWRQFLHANLDEWLDKSNGTGHFIVGSWKENEEGDVVL